MQPARGDRPVGRREQSSVPGELHFIARPLADDQRREPCADRRRNVRGEVAPGVLAADGGFAFEHDHPQLGTHGPQPHRDQAVGETASSKDDVGADCLHAHGHGL